MIYIVIVLLAGICLVQFFYIKKMRGQLREWLCDLREIRGNPGQKLFVQGKGILSEITFVLNDILKDNQKQIGRLKKADAANKQILTNLSHDVRTPLASMIGYLEALNQNMANDPKEYMETAYQKALALKSLIDTLFDWCKITSAEQKYQLSPQDVNELTREVMIEWIPILENKKIELKTELSDEEYMVNIDRPAYKRIINNLVQNAIYHGKCTAVTIRIERRQTQISVTVANNGIPIPEDRLPYIFERLYKCDDARSGTGSGLGLAIAKELTSAMDGVIRVESTGPETAFCLLFPVYEKNGYKK